VRTPTLRAPGAGISDVVVGVLAGACAAVLVLGLPPIVPIAGIGGLAVLAVVTRVDVGSLASTLMLLTAFTMPMNRLLAGPAPMSDILLLLAIGVYALIRLADHGSLGTAYRPILVGLVLLTIGGFIGAVFEAPGAFFYKALGEPVRDVSGWGQNIGNLAKFVLGSFMPMALWILARPDRAFMRRILGAFVAGCTVSAIAGLALPLGKLGTRSVGITVHPGQFGSLCLLGTGVALALLLTTRGFRGWAAAVLPVLAVGVLLSGSRAALGGLIVLAVVIGPLARNRALMGILLAGAAVVLAIFAFGIIRPEGDNALGRTFGTDSGTAERSSEVRDDLGERVFARWKARPLTGNGYNYMRPSHNVYLGVIASAGVLGVIGFGTILASVLRRAWRRRGDLVAVGVSASYVAYLGAAYFDNIFWWRWLWFYVGMVVAVCSTRPIPDEVGYVPPADDDPEQQPDTVVTVGPRAVRTS
jgi:hypothetical protein